MIRSPNQTDTLFEICAINGNDLKKIEINTKHFPNLSREGNLYSFQIGRLSIAGMRFARVNIPNFRNFNVENNVLKNILKQCILTCSLKRIFNQMNHKWNEVSF